MPLYRTIDHDRTTKVLVWKIEEDEELLSKNLTLRIESKERLAKMKSELHRRGFLSVRQLLWSQGYDDHQLSYNDCGKPFLSDGKHISITHSFHFAAVILSDKEVGVDIERNREKIKKIQHRFVNTNYDSLSTEDLVKQLTVIWGAKESMYKTYPYGGLSFHDHIAIDPFLFVEQRSTGRVEMNDWKRRYEIFFEFFPEDYTLVYALSLN